MASAECHKKHRLDRCKFNLLIKPKPKKGHAPQETLFVIQLRSDLGRTTFQFDLQNKLQSDDYQVESPPEVLWNHIKYTALQLARESLALSFKKNKGWL